MVVGLVLNGGGLVGLVLNGGGLSFKWWWA